MNLPVTLVTTEAQFNRISERREGVVQTDDLLAASLLPGSDVRLKTDVPASLAFATL